MSLGRIANRTVVVAVLLFLALPILVIVAVSFSAGLIPAVQPSFYEHFPTDFQVIFGSSITSTVIVVFTLNLVFNHWVRSPKGESAVSLAVREGGVAVNVPERGVPDDPTSDQV